MADEYEGISENTKALYLCIKRQLKKPNHPVMMVNKKFAEMFCLCYKHLVDRKKAKSVKLKKRLDYLNDRMMSAAQHNGDLDVSTVGLDPQEGRLAPTLTQKPNYLLTNQIVGDVKTFIKILLKMAKDFYMPVIKRQEMADISEDLVESVTNIVLSDQVYKIVFSFFRLEFTQLESDLKDRFKEFKGITPGE